MEKLDKKIIYELDNDARQSFSTIAKKLNTSKQVIINHTNKLLENNTIQKFLTIIDLSKVELHVHKIYLRLIRATLEDEEQIVSYLQSHPLVSWLVRTEGIYDIAFATHTKEINELHELLQELENKFGSYIQEKTVNRILTGEFFHRDYLVENKKSELRKNVVFQTKEKPIKLDKTDLTILGSLAIDSRTNIINIASKTKITADAVGKRIKKLEHLGIIKNYIIVLNNQAIQQLHYKILIKTTQFNNQIEKKFIEFCKQDKHITFYNQNIGSWEIEIDMEVHSSEEFRNIMRSIKNEFADSIREYFSLIIYDVVKFNFLPMYNE